MSGTDNSWLINIELTNSDWWYFFAFLRLTRCKFELLSESLGLCSQNKQVYWKAEVITWVEGITMLSIKFRFLLFNPTHQGLLIPPTFLQVISKHLLYMYYVILADHLAYTGPFFKYSGMTNPCVHIILMVTICWPSSKRCLELAQGALCVGLQRKMESLVRYQYTIRK